MHVSLLDADVMRLSISVLADTVALFNVATLVMMFLGMRVRRKYTTYIQIASPNEPRTWCLVCALFFVTVVFSAGLVVLNKHIHHNSID